jgi:hypothetical protein
MQAFLVQVQVNYPKSLACNFKRCTTRIYLCFIRSRWSFLRACDQYQHKLTVASPLFRMLLFNAGSTPARSLRVTISRYCYIKGPCTLCRTVNSGCGKVLDISSFIPRQYRNYEDLDSGSRRRLHIIL